MDTKRGWLLLVDLINAMDFEGTEPLVRQAVPMAPRIAALRQIQQVLKADVTRSDALDLDALIRR